MDNLPQMIALAVIWFTLAFIVYPFMVKREIKLFFSDPEQVKESLEIGHDMLMERFSELLTGAKKSVQMSQRGSIGAARRYMSKDLADMTEAAPGMGLDLAIDFGLINEDQAGKIEKYLPLVQMLQAKQAAAATISPSVTMPDQPGQVPAPVSVTGADVVGGDNDNGNS